jgi:hypothetical protein
MFRAPNTVLCVKTTGISKWEQQVTNNVVATMWRNAWGQRLDCCRKFAREKIWGMWSRFFWLTWDSLIYVVGMFTSCWLNILKLWWSRVWCRITRWTVTFLSMCCIGVQGIIEATGPSEMITMYLASHTVGSLWCRQSQQSFNTLTPFNFLFLYECYMLA